jgi:hypothetical protein
MRFGGGTWTRPRVLDAAVDHGQSVCRACDRSQFQDAPPDGAFPALRLANCAYNRAFFAQSRRRPRKPAAKSLRPGETFNPKSGRQDRSNNDQAVAELRRFFPRFGQRSRVVLEIAAAGGVKRNALTTDHQFASALRELLNAPFLQSLARSPRKSCDEAATLGHKERVTRYLC